jgi:hypothetical protein
MVSEEPNHLGVVAAAHKLKLAFQLQNNKTRLNLN